MSSTGQQTFKLGYQISPIILVNGLASAITGSMLPIVALTQAESFTAGLLSGDGVPDDLDDFNCHWKPLPGTTLFNATIGAFPFANQQIAANSMVAQPLTISMLMYYPAKGSGGYVNKLATMIILQQALNAHMQQGGTYTVVTPSGLFTNCVLTKVTDVSGGETHQVQYAWQFDFVQPLITTSQATQVYNSLMNKISSGLETSSTPAWSGTAATTGAAITSYTGTDIPTATNTIGSLTSTTTYSV